MYDVPFFLIKGFLVCVFVCVYERIRELRVPPLSQKLRAGL